MSIATANGVAIIGGVITLPRVGAWSAELDLSGEEESKVSDDVAIDVNGLAFNGTALDAGAFSGRTKVRMVGGKGGLGNAIAPGFYHAIPARMPIVDVLAAGGETLSSTSSSAKTDTILPFWTRLEGVVSEALEQLLDELGATWRVLTDGSIWVGTETWPADKTLKNVRILADAAHQQKVEFASDAPSLVPGTTFNGNRVSRVEIRLDADEIRTTAWFEAGETESGGDILRTAFEGIVRQATRHYDFFAQFGARVVSQNGDGSLELKLDSSKLPGMSRVPIRAGVLSLKVKKGAIVTVGFLEGSPTKPYVSHVDPSGIVEAALAPTTKLTLNANEVITQNGRALARVGDFVQVMSTPVGTPAVGQILTGNPLHKG